MDRDGLIAEVRRRLAESADEQHRAGAANFFKEPVRVYGVRSPDLKRVTAETYRKWKRWPVAERDTFCEALWQSGMMEEGTIAIYLYRRVAKTGERREFRLFDRWLSKYVSNWAHCDGLSSWLLAAAIGNVPELIAKLPAWTRSRNRWRRRAAAVSMLQEAKQGRHTDEIFDIAGRLLEDKDDMVQKGVGWLLKETYPRRPAEVVRYLQPRNHRPARLLLRYATEKMTTADRRSVLG